MITYEPFWETLKSQGYTTYTLITKCGISSHTVYRLKHNKGISTSLINKLCELLKCEVSDILSYVPDNEYKE